MTCSQSLFVFAGLLIAGFAGLFWFDSITRLFTDKWETDAEYLESKRRGHLQWPADVQCKALEHFLSVAMKQFDAQVTACNRQMSKLDALLVSNFAALGAITAAKQAFAIQATFIAFSAVAILANVSFLLWCRRSHDVPVIFSARGLAENCPPKTDEPLALAWLISNYENSAKACRVQSRIWGRQVNASLSLLALVLALTAAGIIFSAQ